MYSLVRICLPLVLVLLLTGCYEESQHIVLNPDGSGKVQVEIVRAAGVPLNMSSEQQTDFDPQEVLRETVEAIVTKSEGIEAWQDLSFGYRDDGRIYVRGTAYFPDFAKLKIDAQASRNSTGGGFAVELALRPTEHGLELVPRAAKDSTAGKSAGPLDVTRERIKYQEMRGMLTAALSGLHTERTLVLPAVPAECRGFQCDGRTLRYAFDGDRALAVIDRLMLDDAMLKRLTAEGKGTDNLADWAQRELLGGDLYARLDGPLKPQFDYPGEAARAARAWAEQKQRLFAAPEQPAESPAEPARRLLPADQAVVAGKVRIAALTLNLLDRQANQGLPLFADRGWKATLVIDLPAGLSELDDGVLTRVVAADGSDLLPKDDWGRSIHFPKLSEDGRAIVAELPQLPMPEGFSGTLRELAGELTGMTSSGEKVIDLGLVEAREGAAGAELGARVTGVGPSPWSAGKYNLSLHLSVKPSLVKEFAIEDAQGAPVPCKPTMSQYDDGLTQIFELDQPWPAKVRIRVTVHDRVVEHRIPFGLENVDLLSVAADAGR